MKEVILIGKDDLFEIGIRKSYFLLDSPFFDPSSLSRSLLSLPAPPFGLPEGGGVPDPDEPPGLPLGLEGGCDLGALGWV